MNVISNSSCPLDVRYFCANMLYNKVSGFGCVFFNQVLTEIKMKVRRNLNQLTDLEKIQLFDYLKALISSDKDTQIQGGKVHGVCFIFVVFTNHLSY